MISSADVLAMARERAGLTQTELAVRAGVARESVVRWERGKHEPSFAVLQQLVAACGLELTAHLREGDLSLEANVADQLHRAPRRRLDLLPAQLARRTRATLRDVAQLPASAIVVGAVAAVLHGGPNRPGDGAVEIVTDPERGARLHERLLDEGAWPGDLEAPWGPAGPSRQTWELSHGGVLILARRLSGTRGHADLRRHAVGVEIARGVGVIVAHPRDLLRIADASPWPDDQALGPGLVVLLDRWQPPAIASRRLAA